MARKRKSNKNKQVVISPAKQRDWTIDGPPPYQANTYVNKKFRYQLAFVPNTGTTSYTFTPSKFAFLQVIAATTVSGVGLYEAAKIRCVNLFATPTADASIIDISFAFNGAALGIQGSDITRSAQTFGMTKGAHIRIKPHPMQQAAQWMNTTTSATALWFTIGINSSNPSSTTPVAVTLDLDMSLQMTTDTRTTGNTIGFTTATVSDMYYMALDNNASGGSTGNLWKPDRTLNTTI